MKDTPAIPMHSLHQRMAEAMGVEAEAFHTGRMVLKKSARGKKRGKGRTSSRSRD